MNSRPDVLPGSVNSDSPVRPPRILVRSSWQSVNIGDIGHTPGLLRLIEQHIPEAEVTLWAGNLDYGVDVMLQRDFPNVRILRDSVKDGLPSSTAGREIWEAADLFVHGSGPYIVARDALEGWAASGRPYGAYGVTLEAMDDKLIDLLSGASFVFCRDTISLRTAWAAGVKARYLEFAPDAAFAAEDRDDATADAFLGEHGLEPGGFVCVISRLRYTPYFQIHKREATSRETRLARISQAYKSSDHERLRQVIIRWVRETGHKVLVCPEMTYEIELTKEQLVDPLPDDVRSHVVWRSTYWRPDEAASVYARSLAVVSMEMHSPILACAVGTPAFYLRLPTDTCKGQMWRDIGLPEWIFEVEESDGGDIAEALLRLAAEPLRTDEKLMHARERVAYLQAHSMEVVRNLALEAVEQNTPQQTTAPGSSRPLQPI